jgi:hypothetical protein
MSAAEKDIRKKRVDTDLVTGYVREGLKMEFMGFSPKD